MTFILDFKLEARILKMVHCTLPSYDIYLYVYEVSSNYFHLLKRYAVDKDNIVHTHVQKFEL